MMQCAVIAAFTVKKTIVCMVSRQCLIEIFFWNYITEFTLLSVSLISNWPRIIKRTPPYCAWIMPRFVLASALLERQCDIYTLGKEASYFGIPGTHLPLRLRL